MKDVSRYTTFPRSEISIALAAEAFRDQIVDRSDPQFDPIKAIDMLVGGNILGQKEALQVLPIPKDLPQARAFVRHNPSRLYIREQTMGLARLKLAQSRWILGHELGHIQQHDFYTQPFQPFNGYHSKWIKMENDVEWQADTYARYLFAPRHHVYKCNSAEELSKRCCVPLDVAVLHFESVFEILKSNVVCRHCHEPFNTSGLSDDVCNDCLSKMFSSF
jgi:Zn-dependent peptidase ImmA (M78 family)